MVVRRLQFTASTFCSVYVFYMMSAKCPMLTVGGLVIIGYDGQVYYQNRRLPPQFISVITGGRSETTSMI